MRILTFFCLFSLATGCAATRGQRQIGSLIKHGQWLTAREQLNAALQENPDNPELTTQRQSLDALVQRQIDNEDYDPLRNLYARAYRELFIKERYRTALELIRTVHNYALDDEELIGFMDKAQVRLEEDDARTRRAIIAKVAKAQTLYEHENLKDALKEIQGAMALDRRDPTARQWEARISAALNKPAPQARHAAPVAIAPDPDWIEAQEIEASMLTINNDLDGAARIAREMERVDPSNPKWKNILNRAAAAKNRKL